MRLDTNRNALTELYVCRSFASPSLFGTRTTKSPRRPPKEPPQSFNINEEEVVLKPGDLGFGQGAASVVFECNVRGSPYALKSYRSRDAKTKESFLKEAWLLSQLRHPNVVMLNYVCRPMNALVLELCFVLTHDISDDGHVTTRRLHTLRQYLDEVAGRSPVGTPLRTCCLGVVDGLLYLHNKRVIHGDLKSSNILVSTDHESNIVAKLSDFGEGRNELSTASQRTMSSNPSTSLFTGTVSYSSPERLDGTGASLPSDIFAMGIVLVEVAFPYRRYPWAMEFPDITVDVPIIEAIRKGQRPSTYGADENLSETIRLCTQQKPEDRIDIHELSKRLHTLEDTSFEPPEEEDSQSVTASQINRSVDSQRDESLLNSQIDHEDPEIMDAFPHHTEPNSASDQNVKIEPVSHISLLQQPAIVDPTNATNDREQISNSPSCIESDPISHQQANMDCSESQPTSPPEVLLQDDLDALDDRRINLTQTSDNVSIQFNSIIIY